LEIAQSGNLKLLPGCPAKTAGAARQHLDAFTKFKTTNDVTAVLKGASSPAKALVSWICSTLGQDLVRATGDLEISGFPDSVHQFIVVKPVPALQGPFDAHMKTDSPRSIVLFHGTPLANLRSILSTGFRGARGLWMAAEPAISYGYAAKACYGIPNSSIIEWTGGPYPNSQVGALLGCEVSGKGRPLGHGIHVILNLKSIMVRYIFLLPFGDGRECVDYSKAPARAVVEPAIRAAFTKIRSNESKTPSSAESKEDMTVSDPSTAADSTRRKVAAKKTAK
jgi:hypothetical protein